MINETFKQEDDHILVIDDSERTQTLVKKVLSKIPHIKIHQALNAQEGLTVISKNNALKLVLIDITMPETDGLELLKIIEKKFPQKTFNTCMFSARNSIDIVTKSVEYGCDDYIIKPFDINRLINKVKFYLNRSTEKEIQTTHEKMVNINATCIDEKFEFPVIIKSVTEFEFKLEIPINIQEGSTFSIILGEDLIIPEKFQLNFMAKSVHVSHNKFIVSSRVIDLDEIETNKLRAFIIKR